MVVMSPDLFFLYPVHMKIEGQMKLRAGLIYITPSEIGFVISDTNLLPYGMVASITGVNVGIQKDPLLSKLTGFFTEKAKNNQTVTLQELQQFVTYRIKKDEIEKLEYIHKWYQFSWWIFGTHVKFYFKKDPKWLFVNLQLIDGADEFIEKLKQWHYLKDE